MQISFHLLLAVDFSFEANDQSLVRSETDGKVCPCQLTEQRWRAFLTFNLHVAYYQLDVGICVVLISIICVFCIFAIHKVHMAKHMTRTDSSFWDEIPFQVSWL